MTVGLCTITSVMEQQIFTYVMETFELALAQAEENLKGVEGIIERFPERKNPENGMREVMFRLPDHMELIHIRETVIGTEVQPVEGEMLSEVMVSTWPKNVGREWRKGVH